MGTMTTQEIVSMIENELEFHYFHNMLMCKE